MHRLKAVRATRLARNVTAIKSARQHTWKHRESFPKHVVGVGAQLGCDNSRLQVNTWQGLVLCPTYGGSGLLEGQPASAQIESSAFDQNVTAPLVLSRWGGLNLALEHAH